MWVEKYRPKTMNDISSQEETVAVLKKTIQSQNLPHLLFYGPPGTGKTSTILALARELYGPDVYRSRVLELNASDERGINVIREKVKNFARSTVNQVSNGYPSPPYKIIILDEADSMTSDAQAALRRTMELYSKITRFCLICNYVSRIIEPLASRCAKFRFKPLDDESIVTTLRGICEVEAVGCSDETLRTLVQVCEGDLRRAIMLLQSVGQLYKGEEVPPAVVREIAGVVPDEIIARLMDAWTNGGATDFSKVEGAVREVVKAGYSATQILAQLVDEIIRSPTLTSRQKSILSQRCGAADKCLVDGADEEMQLMRLLAGGCDDANRW
ncbi:replication factor C subunit 4 [Quaeritorhiza haematococci]|nr:replication factor C subunit 4 [Quaeritorhiza haematococci]